MACGNKIAREWRKKRTRHKSHSNLVFQWHTFICVWNRAPNCSIVLRKCLISRIFIRRFRITVSSHKFDRNLNINFYSQSMKSIKVLILWIKLFAFADRIQSFCCHFITHTQMLLFKFLYFVFHVSKVLVNIFRQMLWKKASTKLAMRPYEARIEFIN